MRFVRPGSLFKVSRLAVQVAVAVAFAVFMAGFPAHASEKTITVGYVSKRAPVKGIVLYLHGCDEPPSPWRPGPWIKHFEASGFKVYAPNSFADDRPPSGCNDGKLNMKVIRIRWKQVSFALRHIRKTHPGQPIYIHGQSEGGYLASHLNVRVAGIIITGFHCGYDTNYRPTFHDKFKVHPKTPLLVFVQDRHIDPWLDRDLGPKSVKRNCRKLSRNPKWNWIELKGMGHYPLIWDKRMWKAVNEFMNIEKPYSGPDGYAERFPWYKITPRAFAKFVSKYYKAPGPKAFAIGPFGEWAYRVKEPSLIDAKSSALYACNRLHLQDNPASPRRCAIYAVNNNVIEGDEVAMSTRELQVHLADLGYNPGPIDGIWGKRTRKALNALRKKHHRQPVDKLDPSSVDLINTLKDW